MKNALREIRQYWHIAWLPPFQIPTKLSLLQRSVLTGQPLAMELPLTSPARYELCAVIRFLSAKGTTAIDIHRQLCKVYGPQCMDVKNVRKWVREFMYGCTDVHDQQHSGWPSVSRLFMKALTVI